MEVPEFIRATNFFIDNSSYGIVGGTFPAGTVITKYGATTGKTTGKIVKASVDYTTEDGITLHNMVRADYNSASGDSGGPVKYDQQIGGGERTFVVGIHHGTGTILGTRYTYYTNMEQAIAALGFVGYYDPIYK